MLIESVPNFSEGRDAELMAALGAATAASGVHVLDVDGDPVHNRVVVSVVATGVEALVEGLLRTVALAVERIDLRRHEGVHPRVGAADVVPLVPLAGTPMETCVAAADALGQRIWAELRVPVYFYGAAARRPESSRLSRIRAGVEPPDLGSALHPTAGAVSVGARPPLVAYNLVLPGASPEAGRRLAGAIRESSGGMPGVQALAFDLGNGDGQLSMNLVDLAAVTPSRVLVRARELAPALGLTVAADEVVGLCPAAAADTPAAAGRLLEGHLAAAAARSGAERCRARGGRELELLASKLEARATDLAALGALGDALLDGAEESAALPRVLARAGVLDADLEEMFAAAAQGLRAALPEATLTRHSARVGALDAWLRPSG